jgi:hypothetical protein
MMHTDAEALAGCIGAALGGLIIWILQTYAFTGDVPGGWQPVLDVIVPAFTAFVFAWLAPPHTRT